MDEATSTAGAAAGGPETLDLGGLRFDVSFRGPGATLRVWGPVEGHLEEVLRFDDFVEGPHYHVPASGDPIPFDRERLGEPLAWFVAQIRDHLGELLERSGYGELLGSVDLEEIASGADRLTGAMIACVPPGYARVPGVGLQRA